MRARTTCPGVIICFVGLATVCGAAPGAAPLAQVGRGPAPVVDGQLTEPGWRSCAQLFPFIQVDAGLLAATQTRAVAFYDDAALYVGFRCDEPSVAKVLAGCSERDEPLWRDDCVEVMIERPGQEGFSHLIVNTLGATYDAKDGEKAWDPQLDAAVFKGEDYWSAEISVAWADLGGRPKPGDAWRANFCRERKVADELSSWSACSGRFGNPVQFGEVMFADQAVRLESFEVHPPLPGSNAAQVGLALPEEVGFELRVSGADPVAVEAGRAGPVEVVYPLGLSAEDLVVEAVAGGRAVWRNALPVKIEPRPQLDSLERNIGLLRALDASLPQDSPLKESVAAAVAPAVEAGDALREAIETSLANHAPLEPGQYRQLNTAAAGQASALGLMRWPIWVRNNWLDLGRHDMPEQIESANRMSVTALVNEYESRNFVITNLGEAPLRLRVRASDLEWFPEPAEPPANLATNGGLDADANGDGVPDGWRYVSGERRCWRLEADPERGNVAVIECPVGGDNLTVRQDVALEGGRTYTLSYWARSERATPSVRVGLINSGWSWSGFTAAISGSSPWRRVRRTLKVPESPTHQIVIWASPGGSGRVWLDDVTLTEGAVSSVAFEGTAPTLAVADWQELRIGSVVADPLIPLNNAGRLDVPPGEDRQVWVTFPARDLPPGHYECRITARPLATVALQGAPPGKSMHVSLELEPVRLPTHADFAVYNWDYAYDEPGVRDLYEHKVNCFLVPTGMPLPAFDDEGNPLGDMDFSALDQKVRLKMRYARQAGGQLLFAYGAIRDFRQHVQRKYDWQYLDETWVKAFTWAYTQWLERLKAHGLGYDEFAVQVWDEATGRDAKLAVEGAKLLRAIDPKVRLTMDGAQSVEEVRAMDPYIDVWVPHLHSLENPKSGPALLEQYLSLGEPVYTYTCSTHMKSLSAYTYHRLKPWQAARLGVEGVFYWDYNSWRGDPWNDFDGPIADCGAVYDGADGPVTTRRWEGSREGIEDWQIMRLLERLSGGEGKALIDAAIDAVLNNKDQPDLADEWRIELVRAAASYAKSDPLVISDLAQSRQKQGLLVTFKTNRAASGKLLYRIIGESVWHAAALPEAAEHRMIAPLQRLAQAECVVVVWDDLGRVATAR